MEHALIAARQVAERANKANSAFLAAASHDLRQPVQALSLLNGALRRSVKDPLAQEIIQSQQDSLDGMTNLLNSLLDISRLDAGAVQPEIEEFPLQRLIGRLAAECSRQAKKKRLAFQAIPTDAVVRSDPHLLSEIVQNFVSNAIRYTEQGAVTLRCHEENGEVCISVEDSGIGIEADQLESIFREFHQVRSNRDKREGFGLGLAITRRLADLLGHEIAVESTPGCGSSFSVRVPRASSTAAHDNTTVADGVGQPSMSEALVLLIEDDDKVANAWTLLLRAEGYRVVKAVSTEEARS
jgi:signal transduction histidine kinase